jgi:hypothetical protein
MIRSVPIVRLYQYLLFLIITLFISIPLLIISYKEYSIPYEHVPSILSNETQYQRYCRQLDQRIHNEQIPTIPIQLDPRESIPYSYSQWRSTLLLPRLLTRCEHAVYMDLLSILVEDVFKKHNIQYTMMAATLLGKYFDKKRRYSLIYFFIAGSYTRHDLLPWDDDVDICVSVSDRYRLQAIILGELSAEPHSIILMEMHNPRNYDKVYFSWCPHTSTAPWRYPFIDIFYHDQNLTHVWLLGQPSSCPVRHEDVFPLVLRPLGTLWLYGPREPMAHFESRNMRAIETGCYAFPYSHKYERSMRQDILDANCSQLKSFYPYVERQCTNQCIEVLKLGDNTIIHTLIYNYAYRTFLYAERNTSYRAC